jgi:multiple sugar transport system ATP-binding protein
MANISLRDISKVYGGNVSVIAGLNLDIHDGELMVFVGPSGCGKTTLLRMIAGLEDITGGDVLFDDEWVNDIEPAQRGAAMVFQSYALYPHMTVAENLSFSLKLAGASKAEQQAAVDRAADILQIRPLLERKPKALSGGQRQRVAIGRAIVRKPKVFLFDEPLSNLDANLRVQMRVELTRLHRELRATMIYVTHDQVEAMTLGQRIAVFNHGKIEQVGTPLELYHQPANVFVAEFMGSPKMNLMACQIVSAAGAHAALNVAESGLLVLGPGAVVPTDVRTVGVRPEHLELVTAGAGPGSGGITASVSLVEQLGESTMVYATLKGASQEVAMRLNGSVPGIEIGREIVMRCDPQHLRLFDSAGQAVQMRVNSGARAAVA